MRATSIAAVAFVVAVSGCASSGAKRPTTISGLVTPIRVSKPGVSARAREEVRLARASDRSLTIFTAVPGERRCVIPDGAPGIVTPDGRSRNHLYHGICRTSVHARSTHEPSVSVTFTESWRKPECAPELAVYCSHPTAHASWHVIEGEPVIKPGARIHIYSTRLSGATPPQLYK